MVVLTLRPALAQVVFGACADAPAAGGPRLTPVAVRQPADALEQGSAEAGYLVVDLAPGPGGAALDFEELVRVLTIQQALNPACRVFLVAPPTPQAGDLARFARLGALGAAQVLEAGEALDRRTWVDLLLEDPMVQWQHDVREDLTRAACAVGDPGSLFPLLLRMLALAPQYGQLNAIVPRLPLRAADDVGARARALTRQLKQARRPPPNYFLAVFKLLTYCKVRDARPDTRPARRARLLGYPTAAAFREFVRSRFGITMAHLDRVPYDDVLALAADLCVDTVADPPPPLRALAAPYLGPPPAAEVASPPPPDVGVFLLATCAASFAAAWH